MASSGVLGLATLHRWGGGGGRWFEQVVTGGGSYVGFDS